MNPNRPPEAPDWIAAGHPWDRPGVAPAPEPEAPAPAPSNNRSRMIAGLVVLGLVGSLLGGAVTARLGHHTPLGTTATAPALASPPVTRPVPGNRRLTPSTLPPVPNATAAANVPAGVVDIDTTSTLTGQQGAGTGMVLTSTGDILTNNHVIDGATAIIVTRTDNGQTYTATVVGTDPTDDIALLHLTNATGLPTIPLGRSSTLAIGDPVTAVGNAGGTGGVPTVVTGTVQALDHTITVSEGRGTPPSTLHGLVQTDAPLQPGDSGGPMLDHNATVIGINTAASASGNRFDTVTPEGDAIPIDTALSIVDQIRNGRETATIHIGPRGFLGVSAAQPDQGVGALVAGVQPGSPAEQAGLAVGDIITGIDASRVTTPTDLTDLIHTHRPNDRVRVTWTTSQNASKATTVTLAAGTPD
jgi:S1-C subfamily serine protease